MFEADGLPTSTDNTSTSASLQVLASSANNGSQITVTTANSQSNCVLCLKAGNVKACTGCRSVKYCSRTCQKTDWPVHKLLCCSFKAFATDKKPSPSHVRAILFPRDSRTPCFVWVPANPENLDERDGSEFASDASFGGGSEFQNFNGSPFCAATQKLWFMFDITYPKKKDNLNRAILNLGAPGLGLPWLGPVLGCGTSDVDMRDFRAMVDFFVLHPHNKAILDPHRYFGPAVHGVRLNSESMVKAYDLPELEGVYMTKSMIKKSSRMRLDALSQLFEIPIAWHVTNDFPGAADPYKDGDPNPMSYIVSVSRQIDAIQKIDPDDSRSTKAFGDYGTIFITRLDDKPVYALHVELWHELLQWKSGEIKKACNTANPINALAKIFNKKKTLEYWPGFLMRHRLVQGELDERPSPYEV
ncbi:uncharacterized protein MKZ38_000028 [Zalerion maritima]|uniref:MYND-type domain-containing protein n=1 Tax=Zalerion maritima TaxID=339359 RepID=A0AAD5RT42_9PEZI|nr:uncharacterized protein MKZ38_000028 [Zalerion maritima]